MRWTRRRVLASMAGVYSVSGCLASSDRALSMAPAGTWNQSRSDAQNTAASEVTVPKRGNLAWDGGSGRMLSVVADKTVYTVDGNDGLTALNAQTGKRRWQTALDLNLEAEEPVGVSGGVIDNQLLVASPGRLRSFNTADGDMQWEQDLRGDASSISTTVLPDRQIGIVDFTHQQSYYIIAVETESGQIKWTGSALRIGGRGLTVFGDQVFVTGYSEAEEAVLRCLGLDTGKLLWQRGIGYQDEYLTHFSRHVCSPTGILIGEGTDIVVYNLTDGKQQTSVELSNGRIRGFAVDDGTAFVLSESGLSAVSIPDGSERWSLSKDLTQNYIRGLPAVGREAVVVAIETDALGCPSIVAFETADGTQRWHYALGDDFCGSFWSQPTIADGAVFVDTNLHTVAALGDLSQLE